MVGPGLAQVCVRRYRSLRFEEIVYAEHFFQPVCAVLVLVCVIVMVCFPEYVYAFCLGEVVLPAHCVLPVHAACA